MNWNFHPDLDPILGLISRNSMIYLNFNNTDFTKENINYQRKTLHI